MADPWYVAVSGDAGILQGDLILDCPLLVWKQDPIIEGEGNDEELANLYEIVAEDVVVMTQACDLEQGKVTEVVVCSMHSLEETRTLWAQTQQGAGEKAWHKFFEKINSGSVWNLAVLNRGESNGLQTAHRVRVSGVLCVRHTMSSNRRQYAQASQEDAEGQRCRASGRIAQDIARVA